MEFTIYSLGSAVYLEEILNSVAMLSGSGDIEALAKIGLIIGVLLLGFQAVFNNTGIEFHKAGVCLIIYMAMFGPTARVLIEDVYTGDVAVVDNVPMGPAAVGSIVSTLGYSVTELFEQAFSTPTMTSYGFADPLNTLMAVRQTTKNMMGLTNFGMATGNTDIMNSWSNYLRECTMTMVNRDPMVTQQMWNNANPVNAVKFDSDLYYTLVFDGSSPAGREMTCSAAHAWLSTATDSKADGLMTDIANAVRKPGDPAGPADGTALEARINNSLQGIGLSAASARDYAIVNALLPMLQGAPALRATEDMQGASAVMMSQALQQQNTQWAAEGSMFTQYVRPFMTFFEGLIYAITPFMAFAMALGGAGIGLASKYLLMLLWMTLWTPIMSIVNLYTLSTTQAKIEGVLMNSVVDLGNGDSGISFNGLLQVEQIIGQQIGVAGLMASSVPAICMFLVYGTSVAASGIASRLSASDHINEKIASPDIVQPGAGLSMSAQNTMDPTRGNRQTGSDELVSSLVSGSNLSSSVQSMNQKAQASSEAFSSQLSSAVQKQYGSSISMQDAAKLGSQIAATDAFKNDAGLVAGYEAVRAQTGSTEAANAALFQTTLGAQAGASVGGKAGPVGLSAGVKGGTSGSTNDRNSSPTSESNTASDKNAATFQQARSASKQSTDSFSLDKAFAQNEDLSKSLTNSDSLSKSAQQSVSDQQSYQQAAAAMQSYGFTTNTNGLAVAEQLAANPQSMGRFAQMLDHNLNDQQKQQMGQDQATYSSMMSGNAAYVAAGLSALQRDGNIDAFFQSGIDPNSNSGIAGPNVGNIEGQFNSRQASNEGQFGAADDRINSARSDAHMEGPVNVGDRYSSATAGAREANDNNVSSATTQASFNAQDSLRGVGSGVVVNDSHDGLRSFTEQASYAADQLSGSAKQDYETQMNFAQEKGLSPVQSAYYAAASQGRTDGEMDSAFVNHLMREEHFDRELAQGMMMTLKNEGGSSHAGPGLEQVALASQTIGRLEVSQGADSHPDHVALDAGSFAPPNAPGTQFGESERGFAAPNTGVWGAVEPKTNVRLS